MKPGECWLSLSNANFQGAASVSFASHSLGARVVLAAIFANMSAAGAPGRHAHGPCHRRRLPDGRVKRREGGEHFGPSHLLEEGSSAVADAFPLGNFVAGIIDQGHPWWHAALGRNGPARPWPGNFQAPFEIPSNWDFGHGDYLKMDGAPTPHIAIPTDVP